MCHTGIACSLPFSTIFSKEILLLLETLSSIVVYKSQELPNLTTGMKELDPNYIPMESRFRSNLDSLTYQLNSNIWTEHVIVIHWKKFSMLFIANENVAMLSIVNQILQCLIL